MTPSYRTDSGLALVAPMEQVGLRRPAAASWPGMLSSAALSGPYYALSPEIAITARVSVIIPTLNEARNLPHVFATVPPWVHEVIIVDGRSTDDTVATARRLRPDVIVITQPGYGKGDALIAGFEACTGEIIVTMDADGSTDGAEIGRFVSVLAAGADFAKGSRFACGGGSSDITAGRRWGNRLLAGLVNVLFGTRYTDLCYGYNAFWADQLKALELDCAGFEVEAMFNVRAASKGLRIHEVPSFEHPRVHGASNLRVIADGWRILRLIGREWRSDRIARLTERRVKRHALVDEVTAPIAVGVLAQTAPD